MSEDEGRMRGGQAREMKLDKSDPGSRGGWMSSTSPTRESTVESVSIRMASEFFSSSRRISVRSSGKAKFKHSFQGRLRSGDLMKKDSLAILITTDSTVNDRFS